MVTQNHHTVAFLDQMFLDIKGESENETSARQTYQEILIIGCLVSATPNRARIRVQIIVLSRVSAFLRDNTERTALGT